MTGNDMIVNLQTLPTERVPEGIKLKRVFPGDRDTVLAFVGAHFSQNWVGEARYAMAQNPVKCFIATQDGEVVGFACFDSSAKGFFGPIGVREDVRGRGVGAALLLRTLHAMQDDGYGYAIIGWVGGAQPFYEKLVGATCIPGGTPENSVYRRMIRM